MTQIDKAKEEFPAGLYSFLERASKVLQGNLLVLGNLAATPVFKPHFNLLFLVQDSFGKKWVIRLAKPTLLNRQDPKVTTEYEKFGFFECGGSYNLRSPIEQQSFHTLGRQRGLRVPEIVYADAVGSAVAFVEGSDLSQLLKEIPSTIVSSFLRSIFEAHDLGLVLGDRHCSNAIRDRSGEIWQIDFDIEIRGRYAREFDIAQAGFYSLFAAWEKVVVAEEIVEFCRSMRGAYDAAMIALFLEKICAFKGGNYADGKYREVIPVATMLSRRLRSL
jgi:hypothetical protein